MLPDVADLEITRWRRYGKDRLYVKDAVGNELGWVDLLTGARTVTDASQEPLFLTTVNDWYVESSTVMDSAPTATIPAPAEPEPAALVETDAPIWHDLATHVPGQAARVQAIRALAEMRERSRVRTFMARALDVKTDERAWRVGADGEETVGAKLDKLTKHGWHVLHAVPVGKKDSDIDHVVIGHGGVYTVNTKAHPGRRVWVGAHDVRVNGQSVPYLHKSRSEAERAGRLLSQAVGFAVPIQPVLVFLTGTRIPNVTIKQNPVDVRVYDRTDIPGVFKHAPQRMTVREIAAVYDSARRCTTWTGSTSCTCA
jgi:hypothetical protein